MSPRRPSFPPPPFVFSDFEGTLESPWAAEALELRFGARHRALWEALPLLHVETSEGEDDAEPGEEGEQVLPVPSLRYLDVGLGAVQGERWFSDGWRDELARVELSLHVEPGPYGALQVQPHGAGPTLWSPSLSVIYDRAARALLDGRPASEGLPAAGLGPPACTAAALARSGWAEGGSEVRCRELDEHWAAWMQLDLPGLRTALARGARHRGASATFVEVGGDAPGPGSRPNAGAVRVDTDWAFVGSEDDLRLVTPLGLEVLRAEIVGVSHPYFVTARYFLAVDLDARGAIRDVTVRSARDGTFDLEDDDGASKAFSREPAREDLGHLRARLGAAAYDALSWLTESHLLDPSEQDG